MNKFHQFTLANVVVRLSLLFVFLIIHPVNASCQQTVLQADSNEYISVVVTIGPSKAHKKDLGWTQIQLGFKRIEFDDNGKVSTAFGLNPVIKHLLGKDLKAIPSGKFVAKNGIIEVKLAGGHRLLLPIDASCQFTIHNADFLLTHL